MTVNVERDRKRNGRAAHLTLDVSNVCNLNTCRHRSSPKTPMKELYSPYRHSPLGTAISFPSTSSSGRNFRPSSARLYQSKRSATTPSFQEVHQYQATALVNGNNINHSAAQINPSILSKLAYDEKYRLVDLQSSPLIRMLQEGPIGGPIVWLIHTSCGSADKYTALLNTPFQLSSCTIYTISNTYLSHGYRFKSISQMSRIYLHYHIRKIQPQGPYHLGGQELGGVCAREMATILTKSWELKQQRGSIDEKWSVSVFLINAINPSFRPSPISGEESNHKIDLQTNSPASTTYTTFESSRSGPLVNHRRLHSEMVARLLSKHVPTPFSFGAPAAILAAKENKTTPIKIHLHLLKTSTSSISTHHQPCKYNGWLDESVAPGLTTNTLIVPFTNHQLFTTVQGTIAVKQWLKEGVDLL